jgi:hypothetical protein
VPRPARFEISLASARLNDHHHHVFVSGTMESQALAISHGRRKAALSDGVQWMLIGSEDPDDSLSPNAEISWLHPTTHRFRHIKRFANRFLSPTFPNKPTSSAKLTSLKHKSILSD